MSGASHYTTSATAGYGSIDSTYPIMDPNTGEHATFSFYVSHFDATPHDNFITDLPGLKLEIDGNVNVSSENFRFI